MPSIKVEPDHIIDRLTEVFSPLYRRSPPGGLPSGCSRLAKFFPEDQFFKRLANLWLFGPLLQFF